MKDEHLGLVVTDYFQLAFISIKNRRRSLLKFKEFLSESKEKLMVIFVTKPCTFPYPGILEKDDLFGIMTLFWKYSQRISLLAA